MELPRLPLPLCWLPPTPWGPACVPVHRRAICCRAHCRSVMPLSTRLQCTVTEQRLGGQPLHHHLQNTHPPVPTSQQPAFFGSTAFMLMFDQGMECHLSLQAYKPLEPSMCFEALLSHLSHCTERDHSIAGSVRVEWFLTKSTALSLLSRAEGREVLQVQHSRRKFLSAL